MPRLVVRHQLLLLLGHHGALLGGAGHDALERVRDLLLGDLNELAAGGEDRRLVEQVLERGAREPGGAARHLVEVHVLADGLAAAVHLEDADAAGDVGQVHGDLAVEAPGAQQRAVQHVGAVGGGQHDHAGVALEPVHLRQQLVEGLLALVVAAADAGAAGASHGVDLIHEHDAGRVLLSLLEQVAHARGAHAHEHLHELGAADGEEGDTRLARDRLGKQRLAGAGGAHEQHALGDLGAHGGEALGALEELHNLHEVLLGLIHARHVVEGDAGVGLHLELRLGLAERHGVVAAAAAHGATAAAAAALGAVAAGQQEQAADEQQREREVAEQVEEHLAAVLVVGVRGEVNVLGAELGQQLAAGAGELHAHALHAVAQLGRRRLDDRDGSVLVQVNLGHASHVEVLQEAGVGHARGGLARVVRGEGGGGAGGGGHDGGSPEHSLLDERATVRVGHVLRERRLHLGLVLGAELRRRGNHSIAQGSGRRGGR
mmetsp:Transcript_16699/g.40957  ORF Transcript_16699/g.40957 Transcript_16699/m.40957 type:complete len:488 (+) Transcript_16699:902-2365(+)